jgi:formate hydrogenlyase subunit 3/multisubunit Na+/H+ antiporter MnhD subunit
MSPPGNSARAAIRYVLAALLALGAVNFIPSLVLFVVVGGTLSVAAVAVFLRHALGRRLALAAGAIVLIWIAVQVAIIGRVSWLQPGTAIGGVLILALASLLPRRS